MRSLFAIGAAVAVTAVFALPAPAVAAEKSADGVRNVEQMDVSSQRRYRRYGYRAYGPRYYRYGYYRPYRSYYRAPYYAYGPSYYNPYYGPRVGVGVGPIGFGLRF